MQRATQSSGRIPLVRRWLPDAELDAHPVGSWLLQMGFDLWIHAFYRRELVFPTDFHIAPGTVIASNHQRDIDGPMLGTVLVRRRGLRFQWPLPFYATREDLFRPGILARLTVRWPSPLPVVLGRISLAWFFPLGRAEPMRRIREFTLGETLRALCDAGCGDDECRTLLNARGRRETGIAAGISLQAALECLPLAVTERWWGVRRLTLPALARIAPAFRATIAEQLGHFAMRLARGRCVYFSPEGTISDNGHFGRVRAGFFRLAHLAVTPPWIQPMALGYDRLAPGRSRVVVRIGQHYRADASLDRRQFDATLRHSILSLAPLTMSHLLAHYLLHGPAAFAREELVDWLARSIEVLKARNASLDPLFARVATGRLVDERLRWLLRRHLVARAGDRFANTCPRDAPANRHGGAGLVRYLDNSLADLLPDAAHIIPC